MQRTAAPSPATLKDVALRAGVAPITASRILNGSRSAAPVADDTRQRVERAAADLGYRLDGVARAMRHGRSSQVGVVVANAPGQQLVNLAAYECILGLNAGFAANGYVLSMIRLTDVEGVGAQPVRALDERLLDGLVVLGHMPPPVIERIRGLGLRTVWLDTDVDEATCCVRRDEFAAGRDAAALLAARGRRRFVWLERPAMVSRNHYSRIERERGVRQVCAESGASFEMVAVGANFEILDPEALHRQLADPAVGLILADPPLTHRMAAQLAMYGLVPGRDLGVVTCDADAPLSHLWPQLSRVAVDRHAQGEAAARMLAEALTAPRLPASVRVRSPVVAGETA